MALLQVAKKAGEAACHRLLLLSLVMVGLALFCNYERGTLLPLLLQGSLLLPIKAMSSSPADWRTSRSQAVHLPASHCRQRAGTHRTTMPQ